MNIQVANGTIIFNNKVIVNGKEVPPPPKKNFNCVSIVNNNVFIDGYEYKGGKWKRTLKALYHLLF